MPARGLRGDGVQNQGGGSRDYLSAQIGNRDQYLTETPTNGFRSSAERVSPTFKPASSWTVGVSL